MPGFEAMLRISLSFIGLHGLFWATKEFLIFPDHTLLASLSMYKYVHPSSKCIQTSITDRVLEGITGGIMNGGKSCNQSGKKQTPKEISLSAHFSPALPREESFSFSAFWVPKFFLVFPLVTSYWGLPWSGSISVENHQWKDNFPWPRRDMSTRSISCNTTGNGK